MATKKKAASSGSSKQLKAPAKPTIKASIERLYEVNGARKALEREEEELKAFFKEAAGGEDMNFETEDLVVKVAGDSRQSLDAAEARKQLEAFGVNTDGLLKTTHFVKVTVGEKSA